MAGVEHQVKAGNTRYGVCFALFVSVYLGLSGLAQAATAVNLNADASARQADLERIAGLYGPAYEFVILRNDKPVGRHRLTFARNKNSLQVGAESSIRISLGPLTLYRFSYRSSEIWTDGKLLSVASNTDDDGDRFSVFAQASEPRLQIEGPKGVLDLDAPEDGQLVLASNHWNPAVLGARRVINTLTGEYSRVSITREGRERLELGTARIEATRWRYSGDFEATVWYDDDGRWLALSFLGRDGSKIKYLCTTCRPADTQDGQNAVSVASEPGPKL